MSETSSTDNVNPVETPEGYGRLLKAIIDADPADAFTDEESSTEEIKEAES